MRQVPVRAAVVVPLLCLLVLPAVSLRADAGTELREALLAATVRAIGLEIGAARGKLKAAEEGTGPQENVEGFRRKIRDLEAERAKFDSLEPGGYPAPVKTPADPASVLESSGGSGPVLPPAIREAAVRVDGPCADGALLPVEGASRSGPFYHLAGIAGGDYYVYVVGVR